jgi:hypothetical protein
MVISLLQYRAISQNHFHAGGTRSQNNEPFTSTITTGNDVTIKLVLLLSRSVFVLCSYVIVSVTVMERHDCDIFILVIGCRCLEMALGNRHSARRRLHFYLIDDEVVMEVEWDLMI